MRKLTDCEIMNAISQVSQGSDNDAQRILGQPTDSEFDFVIKMAFQQTSETVLYWESEAIPRQIL
ncbi:MAG: hypothetical protein HN790_17210 [Methylococcales bacterium]|nr:hypothetical protein [Methylococcales bacterium]